MIDTAEKQTLRTRALGSLGSLPPFSPILNRLLASLARDDVSFVRIADLIEKDTVLAGNVLHLVNSALYGRRATVNSIRHAVSLLGVNKLRNAALSMSVTRMWNQVHTPAGFSMARFNLHSVATGMLADILSQRVPVVYAEGAFAGGLFHDIGQLLIAIALPDEYLQVVMLCSGGHVSRSECELEALGFTHADLSADALEQWNLPEDIRVAVLNHHHPEPPPPSGDVDLGLIISVADEYINALGYSLDGAPLVEIKEARNRLCELGVRDVLPAILQEFMTEFEAVRTLF